MRNIFIYLFLYLFCVQLYSQSGEFDRLDCNYSKEVILPFNFGLNANQAYTPNLNQVVFYSYRDQFTYWYQIKVQEKLSFSLDLSAINDSDSYAVYIYKYSGEEFCKKLYNRLIQPTQKPLYFGSGFKKITNLNFVQANPGDVFYVSVMSISLTNCGHELKLWYNSQDTLKVSARHFPCKKDVSTVASTLVQNTEKKPVITKEKVKTDSLVPTIHKLDNPVVSNKSINQDTVKTITSIQPEPEKIEKPSPKQTLISAYDIKKTNMALALTKLFVIDVETNTYMSFERSSDTLWIGELLPGRKYQIKASAFGYKDKELTLADESTARIKLWLEPLKVGDNFIMKSIYFHPNTYALKKESTEELRRLYQFLLQNPETKIEIQGHTNGNNKIALNKAYANLNEEWNFKGSSKNLSLKRAEKIKSILVENGISADRLTSLGVGGDKPIIKDAETIDEAQKNIRVEVLILAN